MAAEDLAEADAAAAGHTQIVGLLTTLIDPEPARPACGHPWLEVCDGCRACTACTECRCRPAEND
ncbi:hypothetical protein [Nocardia paucivorans]|uniref:hypothetical protein n=1 Tax=Nocardia paucivorans TaxID=114259 RepID=UPI0012F8DC6C|nr:hypothetical protein [Nocardia paucivorans]